MKLISSYPRSGSAKLKFILCNLLYPDIEHDFDTMNQYIASIDNADLRNNALATDFMCTHSHINADIYLSRHVGDCLISEYWYKQKYYPFKESLNRFIIKSGYGESWRRSVEAGRAAPIKITFDELMNPFSLAKTGLISGVDSGLIVSNIALAMTKSSFDHMQSIEDEKGAGSESDSDIRYMRNGTSEQWKLLDKNIKHEICRRNDGELEYLKLAYYDDSEGEYISGVRKS